MKSIKSIKSKFYLNTLFAIALVILIFTAYIAWQRYRTQNAYEALATLKSEQNSMIRDPAVESDFIGIVTESATGASESTELIETSTFESVQYTYKPNENSKWLAINKDYFGWIRIMDTNIDYPFVRSHDNKEYLNLDFYGNKSDAGTLFMDYRNLGNFNDQHMIIYGHHMKNDTMFHNLALYHDKAFYEEHSIIEIEGLYETKTYKVFSVYEISADDYAFTLNFENDSDYTDYINSIVSLSVHTLEFEIDASKKLLTLVTCSYGVGNGRTIVHAIEL